ncbi:MAG: GDSL-like Lipase/Acylhydrolase [Lentisphaerae bacterium ADurb.Bin242]|nr:MAG: GDSL-like Lipase/Acylhydrolase [Lentisphaerae bacterium ADurb.Bin242]
MPWGMKNIVLSVFGSSIMEGRIGADDPMARWYNILYAGLSRRFPEICFSIVNGAVGGESTRECMARFDRDVLAYSPDYLLFMIGGNNHDYTKPERIVGMPELRSLVQELADRLPAKTKPIGIVIGPVIDRYHWATTHPAFAEPLKKSGGLDQMMEPEREFFRDVIRRNHWPSLDLSKLFQNDPERYILASDGIHLSPEGHALFGKEMCRLLEKEIAG